MPAIEAEVDLRTELGWFSEPRDVARVAGADAIGYLQGQLSQDVEALEEGATARSFILQPSGKVDAWVRLTRTGADEVVIDVDAGFGDMVVARLRRFLLRTRADIDTLDWRCLALRGPGAGHAAQRAAADGAAAGEERPLVVPADWPSVEGADLLGPNVAPPGGAAEAEATSYTGLRIRAGVPSMGAELTDRTIPAEAGRWVIDASVSFDKGCFTGQELVARIESRGGHVPRQLRGLAVVGRRPPPAGAPVLVGGDEVGTVTSVAWRAGADTGVALGYVGRAVTPPAAAEVLVGDTRAAATIVDLPMA